MMMGSSITRLIAVLVTGCLLCTSALGQSASARESVRGGARMLRSKPSPALSRSSTYFQSCVHESSND